MNRKLKQEAKVKCCVILGSSASTETLSKLWQSYIDVAMVHIQCFQRFKSGRTFLEENELFRRPVTSITRRGMEKIHKVVHEDSH